MSEETVQIPLIGWARFMVVLDRMEADGVPERVDKAFLTGMRAATRSAVWTALRFFDLIDHEGRSRGPLGELVDKRTRSATMAALLRRHMPDLLAVSANASPGRLRDALRARGVPAESVRKAGEFYLHAANLAGITVSPHFAAARPTVRRSGPYDSARTTFAPAKSPASRQRTR